MQQEVILAMLAKEPSHGYELRARLKQALGPVGEDLNAGQVYVTLTRLEKAGLVTATPAAGVQERPDRKVYELTASGQQRVAEWLAEVSWPRPDLTEFHLKLIAAASGGGLSKITVRIDALGRILPSSACIKEGIANGSVPPGSQPGAQKLLLATVQQANGQTRVTARIDDVATGVIQHTGLGNANGTGDTAIQQAAAAALAQLGPTF